MRQYTAGAGWNAAGLFESYNDQGCYDLRISANTSGNAIATYIQVSNSNPAKIQIWARRYSALSSTFDTNPSMVTQANNIENIFAPSVTLDESSNATVAWAAQTSVGYNVYTSRAAPTDPVWPASPMAMETDDVAMNDITDDVIARVTDPIVRNDPAGNVTLVWRKRFSGTRFDLVSRSYSAAAGAWSAQVLLENNTTNDVLWPSLAVGSNGTAVTAWYFDTVFEVWANVFNYVRRLRMTSRLILYGNAMWSSPYVLSCFVGLTEKKLPFEVRTVALDEGAQRSPDYVRTSFTARVPALVDGAFSLSESSAIIEYLEEKWPTPQHPPLLPADVEERARARQIMAWVRSDLLPTPRGALVRVRLLSPRRLAGAGAALARPRSELSTSWSALPSASFPADGGALFGAWCIADTDLAMMLQRLVKTDEPLPQRLRVFAEREWQRPSVQAFLDAERPPRHRPLAYLSGASVGARRGRKPARVCRHEQAQPTDHRRPGRPSPAPARVPQRLQLARGKGRARGRRQGRPARRSRRPNPPPPSRSPPRAAAPKPPTQG